MPGRGASALALLIFAVPCAAQHAHDGADLRAQTGFGLEDGDLYLRRIDADEILQNFRSRQAYARNQQEACAKFGCIVLVNDTSRPILSLYVHRSDAPAGAWGKNWLTEWGSKNIGPRHGVVLLGNSAAGYCNASIRATLGAKGAEEKIETILNLCTAPGEVKRLSFAESKD